MNDEQTLPGSSDLNWRGPPSPREGYAALDVNGGLIVNSVRDRRDSVRLAAGECSPVPVVVFYHPNNLDRIGPEDVNATVPQSMRDLDWVHLARHMGVTITQDLPGQWKVHGCQAPIFRHAWFGSEMTAAYALCEFHNFKAMPVPLEPIMRETI